MVTVTMPVGSVSNSERVTPLVSLSATETVLERRERQGYGDGLRDIPVVRRECRFPVGSVSSSAVT